MDSTQNKIDRIISPCQRFKENTVPEWIQRDAERNFWKNVKIMGGIEFYKKLLFD